MKIVLKGGNVIVTHMDNQDIQLSMYPTADKICYVPNGTRVGLTDPRVDFEISTLVECVRKDINLVTDSLFLSALVSYGGVSFPIKVQNQFDYKAIVDEARAGTLSYPRTVKAKGSVYYNITDLADANAFYLAGLTAVQTILSTGWAIKDTLSAMTKQQLLDFEDPRVA